MIEENTESNNKARILLFTSPTCPACPSAKRLMQEFIKERQDIIYEDIPLISALAQEKAQKYDVMSVPTFIIQGAGYEGSIGLSGNQTKAVLHKYVDLALGIGKPEESVKKKRSFNLFGLKIKL